MFSKSWSESEVNCEAAFDTLCWADPWGSRLWPYTYFLPLPAELRIGQVVIPRSIPDLEP